MYLLDADDVHVPLVVLPPPAPGHGLESPALGNAEPLDRHHQRLALREEATARRELVWSLRETSKTEEARTFWMTSLARDGVISGRSDTFWSPLSTKLYICCVISSPAFLLIGEGQKAVSAAPAYKTIQGRDGRGRTWCRALRTQAREHRTPGMRRHERLP